MVHANWTRIACVTSGCLPAVHGQSVPLFCGCHFIVEFASDLPTRRTRAGACWPDAPRFSHLRGPCATASSTSLRTCVRRARRLEPGCSPPPPNSHAPGASRAPSLRAQRLCLSGCTPPPPRRTSCRPFCLLPPTRGPAWPTVPGALRRADRTCHGVGPPRLPRCAAAARCARCARCCPRGGREEATWCAPTGTACSWRSGCARSLFSLPPAFCATYSLRASFYGPVAVGHLCLYRRSSAVPTYHL